KDAQGSQTYSVKLPDGTTISPDSQTSVNVGGVQTTIFSSATQPAPNTPPGQKSFTMQLFVEGNAELPTGEYTVVVTSTVELDLPITSPNDQWTATYAYRQPNVSINATDGQLPDAEPTVIVPLVGAVQAGLESQSFLSVYIDDDSTI